MTFSFRALELHGRRMWERARIVEALDFIAAHDMTALVLHETDLVQQIVFPRAYFDPYAQWKSAPTRRGENAIQNNRVYFDHILHLAKKRGIEVWIEVKEIAFPDEVLEAFPALIKNGEVCPSEPFWRDFITTKTEELLADFPLLAGMIVSPGSPEGRASRAQDKCKCELCAKTSLADWYGGIVAALHAPIARHGKRLAIRDFAYKPSDHGPLIEAMDAAPEDVVFCIKTTPHDFYPTFPDNPAFGRLKRPQWIEYDVMGQFYGWGLVPCFVFDDLARRLAFARSAGVSGGVFRTEWERVNDMWCLDSLNVLNLMAAAALARGEEVTAEAICTRWVVERGWPAASGAWLAGIMAETWPIVRGALYIDDFVFADCSMFPRSVGRAWWTMETKHSLAAWDPQRARDLDLDAARIAVLLGEKEEALARARRLAAQAASPAPDVPDALRTRVAEALRVMLLSVEGLALCAEVCLRTRWHETAGGTDDPAAWAASIDRLDAFGRALVPLAESAEQPHQIVMLLDHRRVADIVGEARRVAVGGSASARAETAGAR